MVDLARSHTTVSVERATLRLAGLSGADHENIPWVNHLVDAVRDGVGLEHGVTTPVWDALRRGEAPDLLTLAQKSASGAVTFRVPEGKDATASRKAARTSVARGIREIDRQRATRDRMVRRYGDPEQKPWIYLIVATGDIYEDIPQAQQAAREGADVIAVIRSTGQSLLDFVPEGATREGYAGTYATQENFRLMRAALDDSSKELGRYVRLTNYASGLCMPEIAALAGLERLDMMLNDSMYGILFRDINPVRTFVDQRFSRQVHARAGIIINTGEDNYLTTADAVEAAHTVTVSQLLNEYFAKEAGLEDWQLGLGHAFEINPEIPDSFRLELAHALLARQLFPDAPLKWMPPTKHMTGDVFRGYLLDGFFNLVGCHDRPGHPARRHDDRGRGHPLAVRPRPGPAERPLRAQRRGRAHRGLPPAARRADPDPGTSGARRGGRPARHHRERHQHPGQRPPAAAARGHRRRNLRLDEAPTHQGQGPRRCRAQGRRLRQPRDHAARGWGDPMTRRRDAHDAQRRMEHAVEGDQSLAEPAQVVRPYGDTTGDGMVQVSFTLPLPHDKRAEGAALQLAAKMGMEPALLVHAKAMGPHFTFFVVYGSVTHLVDVREVVVHEREFPLLTSKEINSEIKKRLRRKLVVVGACIGTDAHTVGIDAILNIKGFAGEKGLEYYREMTVVNLGAQVLVPDLVNTAREVRADAVLVSQVVTQKDAHIHNTTAMSAAFREAFPAGSVPLLVVGGPRFEEGSAGALGVDRVFGRGTTPGEVASYLVHQLVASRTHPDPRGAQR